MQVFVIEMQEITIKTTFRKVEAKTWEEAMILADTTKMPPVTEFHTSITDWQATQCQNTKLPCREQ